MVCELDAKTRTKRLFVVVGAPCGPCGGHQWWSSAGAEAKCHTSRSVLAEKKSTSMIQYKYVVAVVVVVVQKNEYEYDMIQVEARRWRRWWHTRMCLTSFNRCTEKQRMAPRRFLGFNKGYPETHSKNSIESSSSSVFLSKDHELQKILLDHFR